MIEAIMKAVTEVYNVTPQQIRSKSRKAPLPEARRMIMHFMKEHNQKDIEATNAIERDRTYVYRAIEQINIEMMLYSNIASKGAQIRLKLEKLIIQNQ